MLLERRRAAGGLWSYILGKCSNRNSSFVGLRKYERGTPLYDYDSVNFQLLLWTNFCTIARTVVAFGMDCTMLLPFLTFP